MSDTPSLEALSDMSTKRLCNSRCVQCVLPITLQTGGFLRRNVAKSTVQIVIQKRFGRLANPVACKAWQPYLRASAPGMVR
jgi:hypothetical protein